MITLSRWSLEPVFHPLARSENTEVSRLVSRLHFEVRLKVAQFERAGLALISHIIYFHFSADVLSRICILTSHVISELFFTWLDFEEPGKERQWLRQFKLSGNTIPCDRRSTIFTIFIPCDILAQDLYPVRSFSFTNIYHYNHYTARTLSHTIFRHTSFFL